jgi:protein-tyrosine phosphatase
MRKARTWHPNLDNRTNAELYDEARKLKKEQETFNHPFPGIKEKDGSINGGGGGGRGGGGGGGSNKVTFTHQQNLSWSQAEHLIATYQVINVNPLYFGAKEGPPKQPCSKYFLRGCESIEIELEGPSYITDIMYLGDRHDAADRHKMLDLGITHVVNATRDIANFFEGKIVGGRRIKYINVPINDADGVDIMKYFGQTNKFLLSCVRSGGRALIHCRAGVCRSTTILCAFLMFFETWRLVPTIDYLRRCRFIICPNSDFRQQLVLYELIMFGKSSVKPYLRSNEWGTYKLRALLNRSGIESWLPENNNSCMLQ